MFANDFLRWEFSGLFQDEAGVACVGATVTVTVRYVNAKGDVGHATNQGVTQADGGYGIGMDLPSDVTAITSTDVYVLGEQPGWVAGDSEANAEGWSFWQDGGATWSNASADVVRGTLGPAGGNGGAAKTYTTGAGTLSLACVLHSASDATATLTVTAFVDGVSVGSAAVAGAADSSPTLTASVTAGSHVVEFVFTSSGTGAFSGYGEVTVTAP